MNGQSRASRHPRIAYFVMRNTGSVQSGPSMYSTVTRLPMAPSRLAPSVTMDETSRTPSSRSIVATLYGTRSLRARWAAWWQTMKLYTVPLPETGL